MKPDNPEPLSKLIPIIKQAEGFRADPYPDANGWSVGYGFWSPEKPNPITQQAADDALLARLLKLDSQLAQGLLFRQLDYPRQRVILELAYNLGLHGLMSFKRMWERIALEAYDQAAQEILDSKAAQQNPSRYARLAKTMLTGKEEPPA